MTARSVLRAAAPSPGKSSPVCPDGGTRVGNAALPTMPRGHAAPDEAEWYARGRTKYREDIGECLDGRSAGEPCARRWFPRRSLSRIHVASLRVESAEWTHAESSCTGGAPPPRASITKSSLGHRPIRLRSGQALRSIGLTFPVGVSPSSLQLNTRRSPGFRISASMELAPTGGSTERPSAAITRHPAIPSNARDHPTKAAFSPPHPSPWSGVRPVRAWVAAHLRMARQSDRNTVPRGAPIRPLG